MGVGDHLLAILTGVILPGATAYQQLAFRRAAVDLELTTADKIQLYRSNALMMFGLSLAVILGSSRSLAALGLTVAPDPLAIALWLGAGVLALWALDTWAQIRTPERLAVTRMRWRRHTPFMPETATELRHGLLLVISAAVGEEIVFRGFLIGYLRELLGTGTSATLIAVGLPALVFAAAHVYQGYRAAAKVAIGAALFGWIFVASGSLWVPIAVHFAVDAIALKLSPWLLRSAA